MQIPMWQVWGGTWASAFLMLLLLMHGWPFAWGGEGHEQKQRELGGYPKTLSGGTLPTLTLRPPRASWRQPASPWTRVAPSPGGAFASPVSHHCRKSAFLLGGCKRQRGSERQARPPAVLPAQGSGTGTGTALPLRAPQEPAVVRGTLVCRGVRAEGNATRDTAECKCQQQREPISLIRHARNLLFCNIL